MKKLLLILSILTSTYMYAQDLQTRSIQLESVSLEDVSDSAGTVVYNMFSGVFQGYNGASWVRLDNEPVDRPKREVLGPANFTRYAALSDVVTEETHFYMIFDITEPMAICNFNLPEFALITKLKVFIYDEVLPSNLRVDLVKFDTNDGNNPSRTRLATVTSSGGSTLWQTLEDSILSVPVRHDNFFALNVFAVARDGNGSDRISWPNNSLRLGQVIVEYTATKL